MEKFFKEVVPYIVVILVVILIKLFVISPIRVNGVSMNSTLNDKDIMILNEFIYYFKDIERFDIVVVKTNQENIIKRVIAKPGEKIRYKDNKLYINDKEVEEYFISDGVKSATCENSESFAYDFCNSDVIVPENMYFVMGDNRYNSIDSRYLGFMYKNQIMGRARLTLFPFTRIGIKK